MAVAEKTLDISAVCAAAFICPRCMLRLCGVRDIYQYSTVQPSHAKPGHSSPCVVCLGVLDESSLSEAVTAASAALARVTHAGVFKITVAFPPAAAVVRTAAAAVWLRTVFGHSIGPGGSADPGFSEVVTLREAFKWAITERLEAASGASFHAEAEAFVDVVFRHEATDVECTRLVGDAHKVQRYSRMKKKKGRWSANSMGGQKGEAGASTAAVQTLVEGMTGPELRAALGESFFPPPPVANSVSLQVGVSVANLLLAGSYNKYSRRVSQTPWFLDDAEKCGDNGEAVADDLEEPNAARRDTRTDVCVEDVVVSGIRTVFRPERTTFTAGGREDVDVRMLGGGRPFIVDLVNPLIVPSRVTPAHIAAVAARPHHGDNLVQITGLRVVPKSYAAQMRACEADKRKSYRCVVWTAIPLKEEYVRKIIDGMNVDGGTKLYQKTPLRVLHRRTLMVRERMIYSAAVARIVNPQIFVLDMSTQAGTYVKEACHGDHGRTTPSVAELLGCDADILQLDVARVEFQG